MYLDHSDVLWGFIRFAARENLFKRRRIKLDDAAKIIEAFEQSDCFVDVIKPLTKNKPATDNKICKAD